MPRLALCLVLHEISDAGGPVDPGYGIPIGGGGGGGQPGRPTHPIYNPAHPDQGLPGQGGQPGVPTHPIVIPPGVPTHPIYIEGGVPTHPIVIPPPQPPQPGVPTHPIVLPDPPPVDPQHPIEWHAAWTPTTGWIVVGIPTVPVPTPSAGQAAKPA